VYYTHVTNYDYAEAEQGCAKMSKTELDQSSTGLASKFEALKGLLENLSPWSRERMREYIRSGGLL